MVQIRGLADGFATGMDVGTNAYEARTRRQALEQAKRKEMSTLVQQRIEATLKGLEAQVSQSPTRDASVVSLIEAQKAQMLDTINLLSKSDPDTAQHLGSVVNSFIPSLKTMNEAHTAKLKGEYYGTMAMADEFAGQPAPTPAPTPTLGPDPDLPPQGVGGQQLPWLVGQEQEQNMNIGQATMPGQPGQEAMAMPTAAPAPTQAPVAPQQMAQAAPDRAMLQQRAMEKYFPPTEAEKEDFKEQAKAIAETKTQAKSAAKVADEVALALRYVDRGIYTGIGADYKAMAGKVFDKEKAARTEAFRAIMGRQIGPSLKAFGSGTGVSDRDVQIVKEFIGQDINMEEGALRDILHLSQMSYKKQIEEYNSQVPPDKQIEMPKSLANLRPREYFWTNDPEYGPLEEGPGVGASQAAPTDFAPDAEGWVDMGGGIRLRKKGQ